MTLALGFALAGALLIAVTLGSSLLARLPFSSAMLYLLTGALLGPWGLALVPAIDIRASSKLVEHLAEVVVLISLFTAGLKLAGGWRAHRWLPPLRLAVISMLITVALIAASGVWLLGLPWAAAVLLGGILAPTDPVLASEVQLDDPGDRDQLRYALTAEGGLNDGTAFPMVMLGLGLMGAHELGPWGARWWAVDVLWAVVAGVAIGFALGTAVGRAVAHLRRTRKAAVGYDNFLAIGLIALAYGVSLMMLAYGFLAVFAAGAALRRIEQRETQALRDVPAEGTEESVASTPAAATTAPTAAATAATAAAAEAARDPLLGMADPAAREVLATHPQTASAYMAHAVLSYNEQLEHLAEVVTVVMLGLLLWSVRWEQVSWPFVALVLLGIRPVSVALGLVGTRTSGLQRRLIGWFGIRGVGSIFYLGYALNHGLEGAVADTLVAATVSVVVASIVAHGVSVTPLMHRYRQRSRQAGA